LEATFVSSDSKLDERASLHVVRLDGWLVVAPVHRLFSWAGGSSGLDVHAQEYILVSWPRNWRILKRLFLLRISTVPSRVVSEASNPSLDPGTRRLLMLSESRISATHRKSLVVRVPRIASVNAFPLLMDWLKVR
jgi:hypothetical protein